MSTPKKQLDCGCNLCGQTFAAHKRNGEQCPTTYVVKSTVAVKGWCDPKQRTFEFDSRAGAMQFVQRDAKLKPKQFKVTRVVRS
jgi:hypothetical protein